MTAQHLTIIYRLEPGCLGPQGADYIVDFCQFAQALLSTQTPDFMQWQLEPRFDKSLPEMQAVLAQRALTDTQLQRYLAIYQVNVEQLEEQLNEHLTLMIDQYFGRW